MAVEIMLFEPPMFVYVCLLLSLIAYIYIYSFALYYDMHVVMFLHDVSVFMYIHLQENVPVNISNDNIIVCWN